MVFVQNCGGRHIHIPAKASTFSLSDGATLQHRFPVLHAAGGTEINHFKHFKHRLFFYTHWASPKNDNDCDNADNDSLSLDCDN